MVINPSLVAVSKGIPSKGSHFPLISSNLAINYQYNIGVILALVGIPANLFHILVLTRRNMMTSSTNIILLGIAVCDVLILLALLEVAYGFYMLQLSIGQRGCMPPDSYFRMQLDEVTRFLSNATRSLSIWLGVALAVIRTLIVRNPMNIIIGQLSSTPSGWIVLLLTALLCFPLPMLAFFEYTIQPYNDWKPPTACNGFPGNYTVTRYYKNENGWFAREDVIEWELIADGLVNQFIPCVILPLSSLLLVFELHKMKRSGMKLSSEHSSKRARTTKLVLFMTISFLVAVGPIGIITLLQSWLIEQPGIVQTLSFAGVIFKLIMSFNATIHFILCFFMSNHYRETVKGMCSRKRLEFSVDQLFTVTQAKSVDN
ncbi:unnamed protein product [Caenorhabditis sp. 36 PRJEB53466]|nr:unnamed protein product [Caenorhabditis sp. 36 PRJEB53466]